MTRFVICILLVYSRMVCAQQLVSLQFEDSISSWMTEYKVPIVGVGVIENFKVKHVKVYGASDSVLFNVASLAKPVSAMTAMSLINNGKWSLDEPVYRVWVDPDVAGDTRNTRLTTRILLSHQSGFLNWRSGESNHKLRFHFDPGTKYGYSGEGFEYLRHALENRFGKKLQQLASDNLFLPAGMNNTSYGWNAQSKRDRFAGPNNSIGQPIPGAPEKTVNAADWLITTICDYTRFAEFVINGGGLSKALFKEMITPQVIIRKGIYIEAMGLGWSVIQGLANHEYLLMHTGHDEGQNSVIMLFPKSGRGLVVFTNSENGKLLMFKIIKATTPVPGLIP